MLAHGWNYTCLKCHWVGAASVEHVAIEVMIVIAGIASSAVSAKIDGKDVATAAVWGAVGGACAILAILVFYWTIAGSQIHHTANTRICKLEQQVTSRNERLVFIRQSLLGIADEIRKFDDAFGTFAPPTCALQNFGISLIRASLKCGRTVARDFMTTTQMRVEFENDKQLRLTQRLSVVEFERIAESVNDDDILPEFCKETWLVDSLDDHKKEGEVILSAC